MTTNPVGLYLHVPFCVSKCNYCDFCSFPIGRCDWVDNYIDALLTDIQSYKDEHICLDSIFIGGGTPSLLSTENFERIVHAVNECFEILPDCEFTVEANPGTLDADKLKTFHRLGVNRLSLGLQSIHENELKKLGRIHSYEDFLNSYTLARKIGFENINVDLMYAIPEQTIDSFKNTLENVITLCPQHISLYGLIIEEETPFFKNFDNLNLPGEDSECNMYSLACDMMRKAGYRHYEISNYAFRGKESRHNLKYWRCDDYIGVGLSAHSCFRGVRYANPDNVGEYLADPKGRIGCEDPISQNDRAYEFVMLGLRLGDGFSLDEFKVKFGYDFLSDREKTVKSLVSAGYAFINDNRLALTERGMYVSNAILTDLI